jgi:hypothetical protein
MQKDIFWGFLPSISFFFYICGEQKKSNPMIQAKFDEALILYTITASLLAHADECAGQKNRAAIEAAALVCARKLQTIFPHLTLSGAYLSSYFSR